MTLMILKLSPMWDLGWDLWQQINQTCHINVIIIAHILLRFGLLLFFHCMIIHAAHSLQWPHLSSGVCSKGVWKQRVYWHWHQKYLVCDWNIYSHVPIDVKDCNWHKMQGWDFACCRKGNWPHFNVFILHIFIWDVFGDVSSKPQISKLLVAGSNRFLQGKPHVEMN